MISCTLYIITRVTLSGGIPFRNFATLSSVRSLPGLSTTNALGSSPAASSGTPTTATSWMSGWDRSNASSSAGAT